jgi:hypothetical protein
METWSKEFHAAARALGRDVELLKPATDHIGRPGLRQMATFFFEAAWRLVRDGQRFDAVLLGDFALARWPSWRSSRRSGNCGPSCSCTAWTCTSAQAWAGRDALSRAVRVRRGQPGDRCHHRQQPRDPR